MLVAQATKVILGWVLANNSGTTGVDFADSNGLIQAATHRASGSTLIKGPAGNLSLCRAQCCQFTTPMHHTILHTAANVTVQQMSLQTSTRCDSIRW